MSTHQATIKYCLLGYGYASLVAYKKLLESHQPEDILILQQENSTPIFTIEHEGVVFSPLPIFPVVESELYKSDLFEGVSEQKPIAVRFSELDNIILENLETHEGSLAEFMIKKQGVDHNLCLGLKQWGSTMLQTPFSQVQDKIKRHYISNGGNTRVGYIQGESLYSYAIKELQPAIQKYKEIQHIDVENKTVLVDGKAITYENLVSTIPLHQLLKTCKLPYKHDTSSAGAYFCFFSYDSGFDANQMVYDCDFNSDIIRIFSITDGLLLAQLGEDKHQTTAIETIKNRVSQLAPEIKDLKFAKDLFLPMCYPLESITDSTTLESIVALKEQHIFPLGRFGNWEYSDLHELDWSNIN